MNELITLLNDNAGAFSVIFSAVVTLSTVIYAVLTRVLVRETKRMRKVQTEPLVDVIYSSHDSLFGIIDLRIKNIGSGPAYDITFEIEPLNSEVVCKEHVEKLRQKNFFSQGLNYLSPEQKVTTFFISTFEDFDKKMGIKFEVVASYISLDKTKFTQKYIIDLSELNGLERVGEPDLHKIAKCVEKIQKDFYRVSRSNRLKADVYTSSDRTQENAATKARIERQKKS